MALSFIKPSPTNQSKMKLSANRNCLALSVTQKRSRALSPATLSVFFVLLCLLNCTWATGLRRISKPRDRFNCDGVLPPRYFPAPRSGDNGFRVKIEGEPDSYEPLHEYTVTLQSTHPVSFRGFALKATSPENEPAGTFAAINPYTSRVMTSCPHVATHSISGKKKHVQVRWRAPSSGCVRISASVIQKGLVWLKDANRLSIEICERNTTAPTNPPITCCSCGSARYHMTFYGLWSPTTHPKQYPTYSTHWSNIIGATHTSDYVIWEYGGYASEGVQKVAEWGWPANLETEIRSQGDDVLSVIKTKAQWPAYQPRNLREPPSDGFDVDANRHLVSLLTMLGPSPDWNVGLTAESLCTEACGWIGSRTYDLVPWDAGTDSGITYMSPNSPTVPHEKIRALTTSDHIESPFYNPQGGPIPPVARVVIRRMSIQGEQCGESEEVSGNHTTSDVTSSQSDADESCVYGEWGAWSECGVTCGWGIKTRTRPVNSQGSAACEATMEKEICQGSGDCGNASDATVCLYSEWTSWSACSASCGSSLRSRTRVLQWPSEPRNCHEPLKEMSDCEMASCACAFSEWSDWMSCPVTCGIGQTLRKRTLLSAGSVCEEPLLQFSQCMTSMSCDEVAPETPGCTYTRWSDWSPCPVTCGVSQSFRKRVLRSSTNALCKSFYMQTSKCMTSTSCDAKCQYGDWSEWMACSESCGVGTTLRKRFLSGPTLGGNCDEFILETAPCQNPPCVAQPESSCSFSPWSPWMPCSVTCGKGETLRKRFLNRTLSSGICEDFEMETNQCMVSCDVPVTSVQCVYSDWSPWMPCQNCETFRKRLLQSAPAGGMSCEPFIMETKRCTLLICDTDLEVSTEACATLPWGRWSPCSATDGRIGRMTKTRQLVDRTSQESCPGVLLTKVRRCRLPSRNTQACTWLPWSEWTSCDAVCQEEGGFGYQYRHRSVDVSSTAQSARGCYRRRRRQKQVCQCETK